MQPVVVLKPHDSRWSAAAGAEAERLLAASSALVAIHHIGSTAIPGILAKPIIDLIGVAKDLAVLDQDRSIIEGLGYEWRGEYGLPGRRYCKLSSTADRSLVHLHCYSEGDPSIARHLTFRDHLRACPEAASAYQQEKLRCARLHPADGGAYTECKSAWITLAGRQAVHKL
jgi:GrpB-like predicted nucleotidyltransferase (UPF0157 family)